MPNMVFITVPGKEETEVNRTRTQLLSRVTAAVYLQHAQSSVQMQHAVIIAALHHGIASSESEAHAHLWMLPTGVSHLRPTARVNHALLFIVDYLHVDYLHSLKLERRGGIEVALNNT